MRWTQQARETGGLPHLDHFGPGPVKIQVATHCATRIELGLPQLGTRQVNKIHALAHHQEMLLRLRHVTQVVQGIGHMLRGTEVDLALHAQKL